MTTTQDLNLTDSNFTADAETTKLATLDIISVNKADIFSKGECTQILENCIEELWLPSKVVGSNDLHKSSRQKLRGDVTEFPFNNLRDITKAANTEIYDFKLLGIIDQDFPQVFKYDTNDYYNWHIELNPMAPSRKLTFIVNLSDPESYTGGELEFLNTKTDSTSMATQGAVLIFPSFMPYKINPVTSGTKHIIVGHVHGALFR
jgi:PKHD-type hydroxylase